ncbi:fasciculation and elongation protein zeta-2 [Brachionichthys hirsutus]|uniref:fasciculation and elongation protein zeta-2 n=1 Tax=Brachionichthys hirsutus TaxID=412623 RepID=UPI00360454F8
MAAHRDDRRPIVGDVNVVSDQKLSPQRGRLCAAGDAAAPGNDGIRRPHDKGCPPGGTGVFRSAEDLLSACFRNVSMKTDKLDPASLISEQSLLQRDEIWNALTRNYGRVKPVDWTQSRTCSLRIPTFKLGEKPEKTDVTLAPSDDEELREQLDMHAIVVSFFAEEPLFTAEQVIEELEEMMQDSPDLEAEQNDLQSDLSMLSLDTRRITRSPSYEKKVRTRNVAELYEHLEELETNISRFSEELVQQLALRDELEFEKEVKNSFISALIDVQNGQREHRELLKKKKKKKLKGGAGQGGAEKTLGSRFGMGGLSSAFQNSFRLSFGSGCSERQYLTTVIPYEKTGPPPSLQDLQILTKILQAMREDSDKVPGLLTDYILKVLCPT